MKIALTLLTFTLLVHFSSYSREELFQLYSVDSVLKVASLKPNQSAFSFTFYDFELLNKSRQLQYSFNGINKVVTMDARNHFNVQLPSGKYVFEFYYSSNYYEIRTDSIPINSQYKAFVSVFWNYTDGQMQEVEKPVIYLYPLSPAIIDVKVQPKGNFTFCYPAYEDGWNVKADPSGELTIGTHTYNYLFWESEQQIEEFLIDWKEGFVVEQKKTTAFLEEKLTLFGLNDKEKADFITFWGPQLIKNPKNFIQFIVNEKCDQFATLNITPAPDHIYRIYMIYAPLQLSQSLEVREQVLSKIDRSGFTVIEWGGSQIPMPTNRILSKLN